MVDGGKFPKLSFYYWLITFRKYQDRSLMSENTYTEVIVKEELQSDADLDLRGKARVSIDVMKKLELVSGDIIEIHGKQSAAAIVTPGNRNDTGLSIIRIDSDIRINAGTAVDEKVKICKADAEIAQKIVVTIPPDIIIAGSGEQWILKILKGRLVKEGQTYRFVLFGDVDFISNSIQITISRVIPKGIVYVSGKTEIELKKRD